MKKKLVCMIAVLVLLVQSGLSVTAKTKKHYSHHSSEVSAAILKYKHGNYTGCIQDCQRIAHRNPVKTPPIVAYYLAMSFAQAGRKKEAIGCYNAAIRLGATGKLKVYAAAGRDCLASGKCDIPSYGGVSAKPTELDRFIASPSRSGMSSSVRKDYRQKQLDSIRDQINSGRALDSYSFRKINYSEPQSEKIAQAKPTDAEVNAALKVLNDAGMDTKNITKKDSNESDAQMQAAQAMSKQNAQMMEMNALMGGGNANSNNSDAMLNMLPYMVTQNKAGSSNYSPQFVQAVIMNSMMNNMNNLNMDNDK